MVGRSGREREENDVNGGRKGGREAYYERERVTTTSILHGMGVRERVSSVV